MTFKAMVILNYLVLGINLSFLICNIYYNHQIEAIISLVGLAFCVRSVFIAREINSYKGVE